MCVVCETKARFAGRQARLDRFGVGDCPYPLGESLSAYWIMGWTEEDRDGVQAARALEHLTARERIVR